MADPETEISPDMDCASVMMELTNNFIKYNDEFLHVFRNSGKDYNDYGRFEDCTDIHDFNYYLATVLHKFPIPFTLGLCLPSQCSIDDLNEFKPFFINVINAMIPNMFEEVKGFNNSTQILEEELHFIDPVKENALTTKFSLGAFSFITVFTAFVLAIIASTFVLMKRRQIAFDSMKKRKRVSPVLSPVELPVPNTAKITKCEKLMRCFSVTDNLQNLMRPLTKRGDEEFEVLNGIRVLCCALIILGNTYFYILRSPL